MNVSFIDSKQVGTGWDIAYWSQMDQFLSKIPGPTCSKFKW